MTVEEVIDLIENNADNEVDEEEEDNIDAVKQKTLTEDVINEAMNKIESAMKLLRDSDKDTARQEKCETAITNAMMPYRIIVRELNYKRKQPKIDSIFDKQRKL